MQMTDLPQSVSDKGQSQPVAALVIEGLGLLFFLYYAFCSSSKDVHTQYWIQDNGGGVLCIGFLLIAASFVLFRIYKKKSALHGFGQVGYIASLVLFLLAAILFVLSIVMSIGTLIVMFMIGGNV